jgi:alkylation response protein AidB-like acyl-CoA dehydrogenase
MQEINKQQLSTEELQFIEDAAQQFADTHIRPQFMDWDESQEFPREVFTKMGELGFMGVLSS